METKGYQVRYAGGKYWILDMTQDGLCYKMPVSLNDTGMYIYKKFCDGETALSIAEDMNKDFEVSVSNALKDVEEFIEMMMRKGIIREGWDK